MIWVIATIEVTAGKRDAFLDEFRQLVPLVREEQGCIQYGPTVDLETSIEAQGSPRGNVVVVVEQWETLEDLEAHLIAPHMLDYRRRARELNLVQHTSIQILEPV